MSKNHNTIFVVLRKLMSTSSGIDDLRNGPFNLQGGGYGFLFRSEFFFSDKLEFIFFVARSANFFFQNLTLGYMTKTLNQIIFSSTKIRIFFSATLGIRIFFLKKNITPPLQVKWSVP